MKKYILFIFGSLLFIKVDAYDFEVNGICYDIISLQDHTVEVATRRQDFGADNYTQTYFVVPSTVSYQGIEWSVLGLGEYAFWYCDIQDISLPSTLQYMKLFCLARSSLSSISVPKDVLIEGQVFRETNLRTIDLSMTHLVQEPLINSPYMHGTGDNQQLQQGYCLFTLCYELSSAKLPEDLTSIGEWMFENCENLEKVTIPFNVESLWAYAFRFCRNLKEINCSQVKMIDAEVFNGCRKLERVYLGNLWHIGEDAFSDCPALKDIVLFGTDPVDIPDNAFTNGHYAFATLWVPEGTVELYKNRAGWKNFGNIKEGTPDNASFAVYVEPSAGGNTYFSRSSKMATQHFDYVNKGEDRNIVIEPDEGKEIESITINGEDVTYMAIEESSGAKPLLAEIAQAETATTFVLPIKNVEETMLIEVTYKDKNPNRIAPINSDRGIRDGKIYSIDGKVVGKSKSKIYIQNNKKYISR